MLQNMSTIQQQYLRTCRDQVEKVEKVENLRFVIQNFAFKRLHSKQACKQASKQASKQVSKQASK